MKLTPRRLLTISGASLAIGLTALPAIADQKLEEVVVSARKREESLQEVPLAITAITETELQRRSIRDMKDIAQNTPGLTFFDVNSQLAVPVIRGLSQTVIAAPDRNVAIFYNGVFLSNTNASNFDLLDMERIEVVKGPVSALYGRNAFNGAINYVPKKANLTGGLKVMTEATFGSDERYGIKGSVNIPLGDNLAVLLAGGYDEWDGSIKNVLGGKIGGYEATSAAWDIRWNPTDALSVGQFGFYVDDTREQNAQFSYDNNCGQAAGSGTSAANPARPAFYCGALRTTKEIAVDPRAKGSSRNGIVTGLNVDYDFGPVTASILGGFANLQQESFYNRDFVTDPRGLLFYVYPTAAGPTGGAQPLRTDYYKTFLGSGPDTTRDMTWEFRLASDAKQRFRWMIGASDYSHYLTRSNKYGVDSTGKGPGVPWSVYTRFYPSFKPVTDLDSLVLLSLDHINDEGKAGYANLEFDVTDQLKIGGDVRYDSETRKLTNNLTGSVQNREDKYWTYRANVDYRIDPTKMVYASVAKGVIAGFFNGTVDASAGGAPVPVDLQNYKPSTNLTYEIGAKTTWFDRRLQANLAVFYISYKDLQITSAPPPPLVTALTTNAAAATAKGFELSLDGRLSDRFTAGLGYAYTDPKYSKGAIDLSNNRYCGVGTPPICRVDSNGRVTGDVSGYQLTRASKSTLNAYVQYDAPLTGDWTWFARLDGRHQSKQYPRSLPIEWYEGYSIANARLGFNKGETFDVELWVKNLADKVYVMTGITQPNANALPVQLSGLPDFIPNSVMGDRRSYGVTARYKF